MSNRPHPWHAAMTAAGLYGLEGLRAQGIYVPKKEFDRVLTLMWHLGNIDLDDDEIAVVTSVTSEPRDSRNGGDNGVMTPKDVADTTGLGEHAVRRAARLGLLSGSRRGGRWYFEPEAVDAWRSHDS